jgi:hypothetical protein
MNRILKLWLGMALLAFGLAGGWRAPDASAQIARSPAATRAHHTDPSLYYFAFNCYRALNKSGAISVSTATKAGVLLTCQAPDYDALDPIFAFPNFYVLETGAAVTEQPVATGFTIEAVGVKVQSASASFACTLTGGGVIDPASTAGGVLARCPGVIPAGAQFDLRIALGFTANQTMPGGPKARNGTLEGMKCSTTSFASWAVGTAPIGSSGVTGAASCTFAAGFFYAPQFGFARGGDGRASALIRGDSICYSKGQDYSQFPNGAGGVVAIGLDSATNGLRLAGGNTCIASSRPQYGYSGDASYNSTVEQLVHGLIDQVTTINANVQPYSHVVYQHGTNSVGQAAYPDVASFETMIAGDIARVRAWHNVPVIVSTMLPTVTSIDRFSTSASVATCTGSLNTSKVLTVTACSSGTLAVGQHIQMGTYSGQILINSLGTGTGGAGTYNTSSGATIASTTLTAWNQQVSVPNRDYTDRSANIRWPYNDDLIKTRLNGQIAFAAPVHLGLSADPINSRDRVVVHPWASVTAAADAGSGTTLIVVGACPPLGSSVNIGGQAQVIVTATYDGTNCTLTGTNTTGISGTWGTRTAGTAVNAQYFGDGQSAVAGLHPTVEGYQRIAPWWQSTKEWLRR